MEKCIIGKNYCAFTLVELLVSVSIISIMSIVMAVVINPSQKKAQARDVSRKSGIAQISNALSNYFVQIGYYPSILADLVPDELKTLVKDPSGADFNYLSQDEEGGSCTTSDRDCLRAVLYSKYEVPNNACSSGAAFWGWTSSSLRTGKICKEGLPEYSDIPTDD